MKTDMFKPLMIATALAIMGAAMAPAVANADDMMSGDSMMSSDITAMVGGAAMYPTKNIIENAVKSKDHTTLVAAVKAAGLVKALEGPGPFTVFAPTNEAFAALPASTVDTLLKPENKAKLQKILKAHVVAGDIFAKTLLEKGKGEHGYAMKTLSGDTIVAFNRAGYVYIVDENGDAAKVTIPDVDQSNGVIHVVNKVLLPK